MPGRPSQTQSSRSTLVRGVCVVWWGALCCSRTCRDSSDLEHVHRAPAGLRANASTHAALPARTHAPPVTFQADSGVAAADRAMRGGNGGARHQLVSTICSSSKGQGAKQQGAGRAVPDGLHARMRTCLVAWWSHCPSAAPASRCRAALEAPFRRHAPFVRAQQAAAEGPSVRRSRSGRARGEASSRAWSEPPRSLGQFPSLRPLR